MLAGNAEHSGDHHPDDVPNSSGHPGLLEHSFDNDSADESLIQPALSLDQDNDNKSTNLSNEDQESDLVSSDPEEASGDGEVISVVEAGEDVPAEPNCDSDEAGQAIEAVDEAVAKAVQAKKAVAEAGQAQEAVAEAGHAQEVVVKAGQAQEAVVEAGQALQAVVEAGKAHEAVAEVGKAQEAVVEAGKALEAVMETGGGPDHPEEKKKGSSCSYL